MARRKRSGSKANQLALLRELSEALENGNPLPPPWDSLQKDHPLREKDLTVRLQDALKIPTMGPARQMVSAHDGSPREAFFPDRVWTLRIMPSFHNHGFLAVFESRSRIRCALICKGNLPDQPDAEHVIVDSFFEVREWEDPVLSVLEHMNIAPTPDRSLPEGNGIAVCDGIGYDFRVKTHEYNLHFTFSNPQAGAYRKLECACMNTAKQIAKRSKDPQISNFMKTWRSYLRD